jgi:hypothetical protein
MDNEDRTKLKPTIKKPASDFGPETNKVPPRNPKPVKPAKPAFGEDPHEKFLELTKGTFIPRADITPRTLYTVSDLAALMTLLEKEGLGDHPVLIATDETNDSGTPIRCWLETSFNAIQVKQDTWYDLKVSPYFRPEKSLTECIVIRTLG